MKIILLWAPGCGKGTQATKICEKYRIPHISTGDIFRENIKNQTSLGIKVKTIMDGGNLCPDDVTLELVKDRLSQEDCKNGYLLDGFPRTLNQATIFDDFDKPTVAILIDVDTTKIEERITGRRSCQGCGGSFHIDFIGNAKICPVCGGKLFVRKDDTSSVIKERLRVYKNNTEPLIEYYKERDLLRTVNGNNPVDEVFNEIVKVLS